MVIGSPTVLNLIPGGVMKMVHVNQTDKNMDIQFQIMNGNQPFNVPEGWTGTIRGTKGDAFGYAAAVTVTAGSNLVTAHLKEQLTAVAGVGNVFELVFASTSAKVSTENFILAVEKAALNDDTVISESDLVYANQVLNQLQSVAAVNQQVQQNKANIATETATRAAADTTLQNNINTEAAARQAADQTLQSNINAEASTRSTADASLQSQIDQLVAPSGEAPSAAEVLNARIGADGITYPTLGDAIRTNDTELKSALIDNSKGISTLAPYAGFVRGYWEADTFKTSYKYRVASSVLMSFAYPLFISVAEGYRYSIEYYTNGTYASAFTWNTAPFVIPAGQQFQINIAKVTEDTTSTADIETFASAVTFKTLVQMRIDEVDIYGVTGCAKLAVTKKQYYINTSGSTANINSPSFNAPFSYTVADCVAGDKFTINATGGSAPRAWAFLDASGNVLDKAESSVTVSNLVITAPTNAVKLVINDNSGGTSYKGVTFPAQIADIVGKSTALDDAFVRETAYNPIPITYANKYIDTSGTTVNISHTVNFAGFMCYLVACTAGDVFTISALGGSSPQAWAFIDSSGNVLRKTTSSDVNNQVEIAPPNSAYLIINDKGGRTSLYGKTVAQTLIDDVTGTAYMQKAIRRITGELKAMSQYGNLLVFGFNTDQHIRDDDNKTVTYPVLRGLRALSKLTQAYPYDFVCLGGDACEAGSYALTPTLVLDECVTIQKPLYDAWCPVVPITGNHDAAQNNNTITGAMLFNAHFKRVANSGYLKGWDSTHTNGYIDFASHKIRVIFFDTTLRTDYTSSQRQAALETMLESTPQDYSIITISHHALSTALGEKWGTNIAYQTILEDYASKIICCLSGHCHCDLSKTSGGILYIATTLACCANDIDGNARTLNTEGETAFDNFVVDQTSKMIYAFRYGYGSNRSFDYDSESETFGEIT